MMLGFLLARAGVDVVVLEKHADFLRDFRGDTIHPSTLEVDPRARPARRVPQAAAPEGASISAASSATRRSAIADFTHLPTHCKFIALMPQWDFLDFLAEHGRRYPAFHLRMQAEVTGLIEEDGRVVGVRATTPDGPLDVRSTLVVGADGRGSIVRERAGLKVEDIGAPIDVLWMRLSRATERRRRAARPHRRRQDLRDDRPRRLLAVRLRHPKGGLTSDQAQGLEAFRAAIVAVAPLLHDRVQELRSWDDVKLLTVKVDRLAHWYRPGLLCIGDAAHAMSPVGGVGINLAIQDAVAAANLLAAPLRAGTVERRRPRGGAAPAHVPDADDAAHAGLMQNNVLSRVLASRDSAVAAVAGAAARPLPDAAAHSGPAGRPGRPARACAVSPEADRATAARLTSRPAAWRNSNMSGQGERVVLSAEKNKILTQVGPGTPMGDYLRRYWHADRRRQRARRQSDQGDAAARRGPRALQGPRRHTTA